MRDFLFFDPTSNVMVSLVKSGGRESGDRARPVIVLVEEQAMTPRPAVRARAMFTTFEEAKRCFFLECEHQMNLALNPIEADAALPSFQEERFIGARH